LSVSQIILDSVIKPELLIYGNFSTHLVTSLYGFSNRQKNYVFRNGFF